MRLTDLLTFNPQIEDANKIEVDELVFLAEPQPAEVIYAAYIRKVLHGETQYGLELEKALEEIENLKKMIKGIENDNARLVTENSGMKNDIRAAQAPLMKYI